MIMFKTNIFEDYNTELIKDEGEELLRSQFGNDCRITWNDKGVAFVIKGNYNYVLGGDK